MGFASAGTDNAALHSMDEALESIAQGARSERRLRIAAFVVAVVALCISIASFIVALVK